MTVRQVVAGQSGLPVSNPTKSYWHKEPSERLYGHRSTPDLPRSVDVAIIGSGITGSFAAHFLKNNKHASGLSVIMLEAREACWGATGRNGGHCQPIVYASAPEVAAFELQTYRFLQTFVRQNNVPCDWVTRTGVHGFTTEDIFDIAAAGVEALKKSHPELASEITVVPPSRKDELASLRVPGVKGAIVQQSAASLWPYKLVCWVLERLVGQFPASEFNLQTNTPVTNLRRAGASSGCEPCWVLNTPRGQIVARQVLVCTNAYTSRLLPAFSDLIVPTRGQVAALMTPNAGGDRPPTTLRHSYVFMGNHEEPVGTRDDYLVQRPLPGGELIFGGGRNYARNLAIGEWRDDELEESVSNWLRGQLSPPLDLSADVTEEHARGDPLEVSYEWTGIMGFSRDHCPWVGAVPESLGGGEGLWVCAGYTGHGMPAAALSARAVVGQIFGVDTNDSIDMGEEGWLPLPADFRLSEERVQMARAKHAEVVAAQEDRLKALVPELA